MILLLKSCLKDDPFVSPEFLFSAAATETDVKLLSERGVVCVTATRLVT
jgi:hypothetical protein